jgi:hypothetical protein
MRFISFVNFTLYFSNNGQYIILPCLAYLNIVICKSTLPPFREFQEYIKQLSLLTDGTYSEDPT